MFAASVALAVTLAAGRPFFEKFIEEKYGALPAGMKTLADGAAEGGKIDPEAFGRLTTEERLLLYDDWMARADTPPARTPAALVAADRELYLARAERSLVGGSARQQERALKFLELAGAKEAAPLLRKARQWSIKRRTPDLTARITEVLERLER